MFSFQAPPGLTTQKNCVILYDMNTTWTLTGSPQGLIELTYRPPTGHPLTVKPVLTVDDLCRRFRRSRRQIYRYVQAGRLQPCARVLGQWLFSPTELHQFQTHQLPTFLRSFFWDTRLADLSAEHHREFILNRLLELGDRRALQWVLRTYPRPALLDFLDGRGKDALSRRAWSFWHSYLQGIPTRRRPASWRWEGRPWGGIS